MKYRAQAPLRIDFGGGWSDVPVFAESDPDGGAVLNAAITVYARGYIIRPEPRRGLGVKLPGSKHVVRYELDAPAGAGLGASAAQTLLWLTLVKTTIANVSERRDLAERAWRVENELGILGGKQDHYASAMGGISYMTFGESTTVESLKPDFEFCEELERRLVLVYTGTRRLSGDIHEAVWGRYESGDAAIVEPLRELRRLAGEMREALMTRDLEALARLMNRNWSCQKRLHHSITNEGLDHLVALGLRSGARAAKACGAGGGGCLLFLTEEGARSRVGEALTAAGAMVIPFLFDWYGVHLTKG
ncbi:MAG TPA: GHMP kinase [Chloroflexota bacterium]|nr:GHMP kinase [Chloroflexota bacterium]